MKKKENELNYADILAEIEAIVSEIETGNLTLDEVMQRARKAAELIRIAKQKLRANSDEIDSLLKDL